MIATRTSVSTPAQTTNPAIANTLSVTAGSVAGNLPATAAESAIYINSIQQPAVVVIEDNSIYGHYDMQRKLASLDIKNKLLGIKPSPSAKEHSDTAPRLPGTSILAASNDVIYDSKLTLN